MLRRRVLGILVEVHWSWLLVLGLLAWSMAAVGFPTAHPGLAPAAYAVMGIVASALFFVSVLVHELCHSLQSRREGLKAGKITLFLLGGASSTDEPIPGPGAELRIVAAGPISTLVITAAMAALTVVARVLSLPVEVTGVLAYVAMLNALLLVFNLLPALPLDGGRMFHALLWWRTGDRARATLIAGNGGRALGALLVAGGVLLLAAGGAAGIWLVIVGWFVLMAVQQEVAAARTDLALGDRTVADLMTTGLVTVTPEMSVADLADLLRTVPSHTAYPVVSQGRLVGLLPLRTAGQVPLERRDQVRLGDLMVPRPDVPTIGPEVLARDALRRLSTGPGRAAVLDEDDDLLGLLSSSDVNRLVGAGR
jgi:Zn-dependent protease/CBS domain-containing protein